MKGIVFVNYAVGVDTIVNNRPEKAAQAWWYIPARLVAFHVCYNTEAMDEYVKALARAMESHYLCRFRGHFGMYRLHRLNLIITFSVLMRRPQTDRAFDL